jgi:hypothetical protein
MPPQDRPDTWIFPELDAAMQIAVRLPDRARMSVPAFHIDERGRWVCVSHLCKGSTCWKFVGYGRTQDEARADWERRV